MFHCFDSGSGKWSPLLLAALAAAILSGCDGKRQTATDTPAESDGGQSTIASPKEITSNGLFTDVTRQMGLPSSTGPWPDGQYMTPEITPGGIAVLDYDGDGRFDLYQINHCAPGSLTEAAPNRLFRQTEHGTFTEVEDAAGLNDPGFGHGVAVGDIDNDGDLDVFVANYGANALYRNDDGKSFSNVTQAAGISGDHWSSSAGFFDYDRDGLLDLYVVNFAVFDASKVCGMGGPEGRDYCGPHTFDGLLDTLYHNNGDGTFTDVTEAAGINLPARGWGLACADFTGDGWCDVYIANDEEPAQLWVNQQDGTFLEEAVFRGCAFNAEGRVEAGMGVGFSDVDGDGKLDLFKTHISGETNTLYLSGGMTDLYADHTAASTMGAVDRPYTGWGCGFLDYDHDGDVDMAVANGRVTKGVGENASKLGKFWSRFAEPNLLFDGDGQGKFENVSAQSGKFGTEPLVSRGLAFADLDDDGDLDMVAQQIDNSLRVYRNDAPRPGTHWLIVRTMTGTRDAYGAEVTIEAGGRKWLRVAHPTSSYLASNDPRAHFGLGAIDKVDSIEIAWPSGRRERFTPPNVDTVAEFVEGEGSPVSP